MLCKNVGAVHTHTHTHGINLIEEKRVEKNSTLKVMHKNIKNFVVLVNNKIFKLKIDFYLVNDFVY